ncbi:MAG TPA: PilZ domain-containing protein [Dissulfurispiraceae bacterium]|nr:PilZ domain-containing protein [Dissulfurispiraceae bacterium]
MINEKPRAKRVYVNFPVRIGGMIKATALDLSADGIFVATEEKMSRGDDVVISVDHESFRMELDTRVVYTIPGWGFGARFLGRTPEQGDAIQKIMASCQVGYEIEDDDRYRPTILIIDEQETYWKLKIPAMERIYHVIKVSDGEAGLNALKQGPVDLVISEVKNRKVDAFRILQFMELNKKISAPMIVLAGLYRSADRKMLKQRGAIAYLDKLKTSQEKLVAKINEVLLN